MANLARRENIFDGLFDFRRDFDGLFNRLLAHSSQGTQNPAALFATVPAIEARVDAVTLPESVDTEKINADFNNGVLEITAPLSSSALPKRIQIKSLQKAKGATS
jgi:hypothetical protein